jgi:hypothetical protein
VVLEKEVAIGWRHIDGPLKQTPKSPRAARTHEFNNREIVDQLSVRSACHSPASANHPSMHISRRF